MLTTRFVLSVGTGTYVNQIFGLSMPSVGNSSAMTDTDAALAWAKVLSVIGPNATNPAKANRFGGGIVTLKLVWPLFQRFDAVALGLRTLLHTDRAPSLGFMTTQQPGSTLHEAYSMDNAYTGKWVGSFNHIMMGSPGRWFYTLFAGIDRKPSIAHDRFRTWRQLLLEPPREPQLWEDLSWCNASLHTPYGEVFVSWQVVDHDRAQLGPRRGREAMAGKELYLMDVMIPANSYGSIVVPTVVASSGVTIFESGSIVWTNGRYQSGIPGIEIAKGGTDGRSVQVEAASGRYSFKVLSDALSDGSSAS